jgi:hypothetical protein
VYFHFTIQGNYKSQITTDQALFRIYDKKLNFSSVLIVYLITLSRAMSSLQFMIFEDDKENSTASGLVNKAKECKLKCLNTENIEVRREFD